MPTSFVPRHILVVVKPDNFAAAQLSGKIASWLRERQCSVEVVEGGGAKPDLKQYSPDLTVVLGGDGTLLGVARCFVELPRPLLGLNFGKVGYLAELHAKDWEEGLTRVLDGRCHVTQCMALGWRVLRDDHVMHEGRAVNDVVISRGALSRVISLDVSAVSVRDDASVEQHICMVRADGLIISSPLGSSGYAVSAGGPLVSPELNTLTIMPICPFLCHFPPIVLPHPHVVRAVVQSGSIETFLTMDGQEGVALEHGDTVEIFGLPQSVHLVRLERGVYFKRLKGRGFIEEYSGSTTVRL